MDVLVLTLQMIPHVWFEVPEVWQPQGVRRGGGVVIACVVPPSTPGDNGEASDNGRLGVVVASNCRISPVDDFEGAQVMAVRRSVSFPPPPLLGVWGALELRSGYRSNLMFPAPLDDFNL